MQHERAVNFDFHTAFDELLPALLVELRPLLAEGRRLALGQGAAHGVPPVLDGVREALLHAEAGGDVQIQGRQQLQRHGVVAVQRQGPAAGSQRRRPVAPLQRLREARVPARERFIRSDAGLGVLARFLELPELDITKGPVAERRAVRGLLVEALGVGGNVLAVLLERRGPLERARFTNDLLGVGQLRDAGHGLVWLPLRAALLFCFA